MRLGVIDLFPALDAPALDYALDYALDDPTSCLWLDRELCLDLPCMRSEKYSSATPLGGDIFESLPLPLLRLDRGKGKGGMNLLTLAIFIFGRAISDISELIFLIVTAFIYLIYFYIKINFDVFTY